MIEPRVDVKCPECGAHFLLSIGEALAPVVDIEIERRLGIERQKIVDRTREAVAKESDERNQLAIAMKDKLIADMRVQIDELRRKADTGSQQAQGEVQELALEKMLKNAFPGDRIVPVQKGYSGGDTIHEVIGLNGMLAGAILWESKNTKTWSNEWLNKIKQDMRGAKAALCVIVTATLPKGVETFDRIEGVFVVSLRCILPLAQVLRQVLIDIATIRAATKQGDGATEKLFSYITGQQFLNRITAVMEGGMALQSDLAADKRATARRWARQQQHIDAVIQNMGGMFGELQGLLGETLPGGAGLMLEGDADSARRAS